MAKSGRCGRMTFGHSAGSAAAGAGCGEWVAVTDMSRIAEPIFQLRLRKCNNEKVAAPCLGKASCHLRVRTGRSAVRAQKKNDSPRSESIPMGLLNTQQKI